ncbi:unnamed protein product [Prorocentrum cordatum]|uniref:Uncharacterized protein n=1 Tax=Prorocentrum cordatum TaxID=2364126 RepID=A0ABN9T3A4_9DINO|nr:unnamed protein product [Polarella glacialis]
MAEFCELSSPAALYPIQFCGRSGAAREGRGRRSVQCAELPRIRTAVGSQAGTFFAMVADAVGRDAEVDIDAMVSCCLCIKGYATSIDLNTLRFEMKVAASENRRCLEEIRAIAAAVAAAPAARRPRRPPRQDSPA